MIMQNKIVYNIEQSLRDTEKKRARDNIGAVSAVDAARIANAQANAVLRDLRTPFFKNRLGGQNGLFIESSDGYGSFKFTINFNENSIYLAFNPKLSKNSDWDGGGMEVYEDVIKSVRGTSSVDYLSYTDETIVQTTIHSIVQFTDSNQRKGTSRIRILLYSLNGSVRLVEIEMTFSREAEVDEPNVFGTYSSTWIVNNDPEASNG